MSPEIESSGTVSKPGWKEHLECGKSSLTSCHDWPRVLRRQRRLHVRGRVHVQTWFLNVSTRTRRAWPSRFVAGLPDKACPLKAASTGLSRGQGPRSDCRPAALHRTPTLGCLPMTFPWRTPSSWLSLTHYMIKPFFNLCSGQTLHFR